MDSSAKRTRDPDRFPGEIASRLRFAATRLSRILRQQADTGLTPTKLAHLATIVREESLSLGDLAAAEQVAAPTVTKVVRELENRGLVVRDDDPTDKRVTLIQATPEGVALISQSSTRKDLWLTSRMADLDDDELASLATAVTILERFTLPDP